jgi:hypothetical protein
MGLYAWYRVRLYQRHQRLTPMIAGHAVFDLTISLTLPLTPTTLLIRIAVLLAIYGTGPKIRTRTAKNANRTTDPTPTK